MGGWVAGKFSTSTFGFRPVIHNGRFQLGKKIDPIGQSDMPNICTGYYKSVGMHRIDGFGTKTESPDQGSLAPDALTFLEPSVTMA